MCKNIYLSQDIYNIPFNTLGRLGAHNLSRDN